MITINKIIIQRIKEFIEKIELNKLMSVNKTSRHRQGTNRLIPLFFVKAPLLQMNGNCALIYCA